MTIRLRAALISLSLALHGGCLAEDHSGEAEGSAMSDACNSYLEFARAGNADAMLEVSRCYFNGVAPGFPRDISRAEQWLREGSKMGHGPSQVALAAFLLLESGSAPAKTEARAWAKKAFEAKQLGAGTLLALAAHTNPQEPLDAKALAMIESEAAEGYLPAAFFMFAHAVSLGAEQALGDWSVDRSFENLQYWLTDFDLVYAREVCADLATKNGIAALGLRPDVLREAADLCKTKFEAAVRMAGTHPLIPKP